MKTPKKGNVAFASGYNRIKQTRYGYMMYNSNDTFVGGSFDAYGEFSEAEVRVVLALVGKDSVVMDIGANFGALTVPLAQKVAHVYAFEPQREAFYVLAANMALSNLSNVTCENAALAATAGLIRVPRLDFGASNNIGGLSLDLTRQSASGYEVRCETLDEYAGRYQIARLDLLKIDVEGMEEMVLRGGTGTIERLRPVMYIEADRGEKAPALRSLIQELGYTIEEHQPPLFSPDNFFRNPKNIWGRNFVSMNLLCRPLPKSTKKPG